MCIVRIIIITFSAKCTIQCYMLLDASRVVCESECLRRLINGCHTLLTECMADANQTAEHIQDVYRSVLQQLVTDTFPHQPTRLSELLLQLPHIQTASALLMKTNTIYIPSMLNAPLHQQ